MNETAQNIINIAERLIRDGGYHAFSFRQIAKELEIKSASIHYHFPTKESLGTAVTEHYSSCFLSALADPVSHKNPIKFYISAFQQSLSNNQRACLCGVLAAEAGQLPQPMKDSLTQFTELNLNWLTTALLFQRDDLTKPKAKALASVIFSALEGAITFSALSNDSKHLNTVAKSLENLILD